MSRKCDLCKKGYMKGNLVPRGVGRRVTNRAIKRQQPNLRRKKLTIDGKTRVYSICASCLKRMRFEEKKKAEAQLDRIQEAEVKIEAPKKVELKKEEKKTPKKEEKVEVEEKKTTKTTKKTKKTTKTKKKTEKK